jgi:hypothetical protein
MRSEFADTSETAVEDERMRGDVLKLVSDLAHEIQRVRIDTALVVHHATVVDTGLDGGEELCQVGVRLLPLAVMLRSTP